MIVLKMLIAPTIPEVIVAYAMKDMLEMERRIAEVLEYITRITLAGC